MRATPLYPPSTTSTLTGTYRSHPRPSTLVVTRQADRMFLFYGNQLGYRLVQNLATWTTRERSINRRTRNHDRNVCRAFRRGLLRNVRLGVSFKV